MNISDAATQSGLPPKTIRYYEDIGLIHPDRTANGYRDFSKDDLHRLTFLARSRGLGFSIEDCRKLLALWADRDRASADVKAVAHEHLGVIDAKIRDLKEMRNTLADLINACAGDDRPDCPILKGLTRES